MSVRAPRIPRAPTYREGHAMPGTKSSEPTPWRYVVLLVLIVSVGLALAWVFAR